MNAFEKFLACIYVLRYSDKNRQSIMRSETKPGHVVYSINDRDIIMSVGESIPVDPQTEKTYHFDVTIHKKNSRLQNKRLCFEGNTAKKIYNKIAYTYKYQAYQK